MVTTPVREQSSQSTAKRTPNPNVVWEKLPDDYILPDDPVDNINQPAIAAALTESLSLAGYLSETAVTTTNYGICANYKGKTVVKAPDWSWIPAINVPKSEVERSYTPVLEGDLPLVVMEFLSETEGTEYSIKSSYPPGKFFFYEQILKVENYIIFDLASGNIDYYRLSESGRYQLQAADEQERYWLPEAKLFLGVWGGIRQDRTGLWLRWWTESGNLLPWGAELSLQERERAEQERERAEQERERAEQERERADKAEQAQQKAIAKLKDLGLTIEQIANTLDLPLERVRQSVDP